MRKTFYVVVWATLLTLSVFGLDTLSDHSELLTLAALALLLGGFLLWAGDR